MPAQHRNRKGQTYTLHQGKSKTGTPQYFFSMKTEGDLAEAIPEGYEIYENPNAQVFLRKIQPKLIRDSERAMVEKHLPESPGIFLCDIKGKTITIFENDWIYLVGPGELENLAKEYLKHLGQKSFYEFY